MAPAPDKPPKTKTPPPFQQDPTPTPTPPPSPPPADEVLLPGNPTVPGTTVTEISIKSVAVADSTTTKISTATAVVLEDPLSSDIAPLEQQSGLSFSPSRTGPWRTPTGQYNHPPFQNPKWGGGSGYSDDDTDDGDHSSHGLRPSVFAGMAVAIAVLILALGALCLLRRRRKRQETEANGQSNQLHRSQSMSQRALIVPPGGLPAPHLPPYVPAPALSTTTATQNSPISPLSPSSPTSPPTAAVASATTLTTRSTPPTSSSAPHSHQQQPVILSTALPTYFTGLDTSDHISLAGDRASRSSIVSHPGSSSHSALAHSDSSTRHLAPLPVALHCPPGDCDDDEEPPPPYRPRSVPPISREASVVVRERPRESLCGSGGAGAGGGGGGVGLSRLAVRVSPFDDPDNEVSDLEDAGEADRDEDARSVVSELEGQLPVTGRESL